MAGSQNTGCLAAIFGGLFKKTVEPEPEASMSFPYGKRDEFLSAAELSFFRVLQRAASGRYHVITKVRLADLFFVRQPHRNKAAFNRISRKHVDFLLCHPGTMTPQLAIELDDASHRRSDRKNRDDFVDKVFAVSGLPLMRVRAAKGYVVEDLRNEINRKLSPDPGTLTSTPPEDIQ